MKKLYSLLLLLATTVSLVMAQSHIIEGYLIERKENNANVELYFPVKKGLYADKINTQIMKIYDAVNPIKKTITSVDAATLEQMVDESIEFTAKFGLEKSINEFPYTHFGSWSYIENEMVISIIIAQFIDIGNPIPKIKMNTIVINKATGEICDLHDFISNPKHISALAAAQFCRDRKLPANALRLMTGLNYELSELPLAKTIGVTKKGFTMFYERGEIAPNNIPPIIISIPFSDIEEEVCPEGLHDNEIYIQQGVRKLKKQVSSYNKDKNKVKKR